MELGCLNSEKGNSDLATSEPWQEIHLNYVSV